MDGERERRGRATPAGQALVWLAVALPFLLAIVGLAIDGATVFAARRACQAAADGAARAGALEIDQDRYRRTDGGEVFLDPGAARAAALAALAAEGWRDATVDALPQGVRAQTAELVPLSFLRILHLGPVQVVAIAYAQPYHGIVGGQPPNGAPPGGP